MIIILEPQKDTYVTNLKTINNDGAKANVGHAATLDYLSFTMKTSIHILGQHLTFLTKTLQTILSFY